MVWVGAAVAVAFVLLLVVRAMSSGDGDEPGHAGKPVPKKADVPTPDTGAPTSPSAITARRKALAVDKRDAEEPEGSKLASIPPPASGKKSSGGGAAAARAPSPPPEPEPAPEADVPMDDLEVEEEPTGPHALILVQGVGRTDPGRRRKHNEDAYLVLPEHAVFVIADGMGGYAAGEVASQLAIDVIAEAFKTSTFVGETDPTQPRRGAELVKAIQMSNTAILTQARANEAQAGMGTTIVAARFSPNKHRAYFCHVGDSRAYRVRGKVITQLTQDHTLGAAGITGPAAAKLSRAVGIGETVEVELNVESPQPGDHYMLCCDGLNKMVPDDMIRDVIAADLDLDRAANKLIDIANERGGRDNITVILMRVDQPNLSSRPPKKA